MSDDRDYAHMRDPEAQRTRRELWLIIIIVVAVVAGGLVWRVVAHKPAGPQKGWNLTTQAPPANPAPGAAAPAAAGVHPGTAPSGP